ncbi:hypothetical protein [Pseudomonas sp. LB3P14]
MKKSTLACLVLSIFMNFPCSSAELVRLQNWDTATYPNSPKKLINQMEHDPYARAGSGKLLKVKIGQNTFIENNGFLVSDQLISPAATTHKTTLTYHGFVQVNSDNTPLNIIFNASAQNWLEFGFTTYLKERSKNGIDRELIQNCRSTSKTFADLLIHGVPGYIWEINCQSDWHSAPKPYYRSWIAIYYYSDYLGISIKTVDEAYPPSRTGVHPDTEITFIDEHGKFRAITIPNNNMRLKRYIY